MSVFGYPRLRLMPAIIGPEPPVASLKPKANTTPAVAPSVPLDAYMKLGMCLDDAWLHEQETKQAEREEAIIMKAGANLIPMGTFNTGTERATTEGGSFHRRTAPGRHAAPNAPAYAGDMDGDDDEGDDNDGDSDANDAPEEVDGVDLLDVEGPLDFGSPGFLAAEQSIEAWAATSPSADMIARHS